MTTGSALFQELKFRALELLFEMYEARGADIETADRDRLRAQVAQCVSTSIAGAGSPVNAEEREELQRDVLAEILGFGPLDRLLNDPTVDDIVVNGPDRVYVERRGRLHRVDTAFRDEAHLMTVIQRMVAPMGRRVDERQPFVDARLPDGSRVNVVIPPATIDGPTISIRKARTVPITAADLIRFGTATPEMLDYLALAVRARLNILISGGTGSGKSSLLNVLSGFVGSDERLVTIEDAAELKLRQPHVVRMETRPSTLEGVPEITARDLMRNTLRMRPDRIILGEIRGVEAIEMVQAMTTGHEGSMSTIHANDPKEALNRVELLFGFGGIQADYRTIRRQIASAVNVIVHLVRSSSGGRRIAEIAEISGMEGDVISLNAVFAPERRRDGATATRRTASPSVFDVSVPASRGRPSLAAPEPQA